MTLEWHSEELEATGLKDFTHIQMNLVPANVCSHRKIGSEEAKDARHFHLFSSSLSLFSALKSAKEDVCMGMIPLWRQKDTAFKLRVPEP